LLDADGLRRLVKVLKKNILDQIEVPQHRFFTEDREVAYSPHYENVIDNKVRLSDNSSVTTSSLDEVLELSNSKRRITSIYLSTPSMYTPVRAAIELRDSKYQSSVSYRLRGEDKEVVALADKLEDHL